MFILTTTSNHNILQTVLNKVCSVTDTVRAAVDESVRLPMRAQVRSLNLATSAGIALGEALRQTGGLPG